MCGFGGWHTPATTPTTRVIPRYGTLTLLLTLLPTPDVCLVAALSNTLGRCAWKYFTAVDRCAWYDFKPLCQETLEVAVSIKANKYYH